MADNLVKVKFSNGKIKEVSAHIAYDKNYQNSHGFKPLTEVSSTSSAIEPQKKIENPAQKRDAAVKSKQPEQSEQMEELGGGVETENFTTDAIETVEEKVQRLHKEKKSEQEIKTETGINILTIRSIIKKLK